VVAGSWAEPTALTQNRAFFRQSLDHRLQDRGRVRQCSRQVAVGTEHDVDPVGARVVALADELSHCQQIAMRHHLPFGLDPALLHGTGEQAHPGRARLDEDLPLADIDDHRLRVERAGLGVRHRALEPLLEEDLATPVDSRADHVSVHAAAGGVVDDDVASLAHQLVDAPVDQGVTRCLVVRTSGVQRGDARSEAAALGHDLGDLLRLCRKVRADVLARHPAGGRDGDDDLARHGTPRFSR
jgi:hypothetical protein